MPKYLTVGSNWSGIWDISRAVNSSGSSFRPAPSSVRYETRESSIESFCNDTGPGVHAAGNEFDGFIALYRRPAPYRKPGVVPRVDEFNSLVVYKPHPVHEGEDFDGKDPGASLLLSPSQHGRGSMSSSGQT